uniref:Uncharacterized protein n=1 Tax=Trichogramma kaykai TaxID=54128 RepID=A0ABD2WEB3_9HYME
MYQIQSENRSSLIYQQKADIAVLNQIKEKFAASDNKDERILLLTLAPKFWNRNEMIKEFKCTEWEARKAKKLVSEHGILTYPPKKRSKTLPLETETLVKNFYERDDVSRLMPGMKECISVKNKDGSRVHVQKRFLLGDLGDLYSQFKNEHETIQIGFTKFTLLRPSHCVLSGSSGTHNVCVYVHHENVNLMLEAADLPQLNFTENTHLRSDDYREFIKAVVCSNPSDDCFLGNCLDCLNATDLRKQLNAIFRDNHINEITFYNWLHTDRCNIASQTMNSHEHLKENLTDGQFLVSCDFAENYAFVVQNSAQSFYWNNNQATIFTVVVYYKEKNEEKHKSLAIISDNLAHDTVAVYVYQKIIIEYLKNSFEPKRIFYFIDGAAQHFKNKNNFQNLLHHKEDFGIPAEWHFSATAHGKGACDGIGANIKRGARRASLQLISKNHITSVKTLHAWAITYCKETEVFISKKTDYEQTAQQLKARFKKNKPIPGTLQYHAFIPLDGAFIVVAFLRIRTTLIKLICSLVKYFILLGKPK